MYRALILLSAFSLRIKVSFNITSFSECLFQSDYFTFQYIFSSVYSSRVFTLSPDISLYRKISFKVFILFRVFPFRVFFHSYFHNQYIPSLDQLFVISLVSFRLPSFLFLIRLLSIFLRFLQEKHPSAFRFSIFTLECSHNSFFRQSLFSPLNIFFHHSISIISHMSLLSHLHSPRSPSLFFFVFIVKAFSQYIFSQAYFPSRNSYYLYSTLYYNLY